MLSLAAIPRDWFDWTNFAVGGIGLVLTVAAIAQATGAKAAAERAEKSVQRHNAESDFGSLAQMAKELHGYVENGSMSEARLRTTDLRSKLGEAVRQYEAYLVADLDDLKNRLIELKLVADGLSRKSRDLSPTETVRLMRITGATMDLLAGVSGKFRSIPQGG
jgi:hypothetical protein